MEARNKAIIFLKCSERERSNLKSAPRKGLLGNEDKSRTSSDEGKLAEFTKDLREWLKAVLQIGMKWKGKKNETSQMINNDEKCKNMDK